MQHALFGRFGRGQPSGYAHSGIQITRFGASSGGRLMTGLPSIRRISLVKRCGAERALRPVTGANGLSRRIADHFWGNPELHRRWAT
jgi:hypothetical protein